MLHSHKGHYAPVTQPGCFRSSHSPNLVLSHPTASTSIHDTQTTAAWISLKMKTEISCDTSTGPCWQGTANRSTRTWTYLDRFRRHPTAWSPGGSCVLWPNVLKRSMYANMTCNWWFGLVNVGHICFHAAFGCIVL